MPVLRFLGGAAIEEESGRAAAISSRRYPVALLAMLSTAPSRAVSRGKLVGHLWPETPEKTARNRLATYVHQLRDALGEGALASVGDELRLTGDGLECDVWRFRQALEVGDHRRAAELYGGPFLDGFHLGGSPSFEKWTDRQRERLQRGHREALEALAEAAESRHEPETAAQWWQERAAEDPYDTRVVRRWMSALAAAGSPAKALRVGHRHRQRLQEELGTEPGTSFRTAMEQLRERGEVEEAPSGAAEPTLSAGSVAVLPFENLSEEGDAGLFAAGLHDDLITELSRLRGLTVISRTSVLRFRGGERSIPEIATQLGVGTVVEGAVQSAGGRVRLNVQVIDARTDVHRWAEQYDRELTPESLFDIQGEVAERIAGALETELSPSGAEQRGARRNPPGDLESYRLCVQGRGLVDQRTGDAMRRSIDYFRRAIERDPEYALAWAGLAHALSVLEFYDHPAPESVPDPIEAARRAVELSPELGEAHSSLGIILSIRRKGPAALRELERAVELTPGYAEPHAWLAWVHLLRGSPEEALVPARCAVELDPLAPAFRAYLAEALLANGETAEALRQAVRAREIQPEYGLARYVEGLVRYHRGETERAKSSAHQALRLVPPHGSPTHAEVRALLAVIRSAAGDESGARELLSRILDQGTGFAAGLVHAALGEAERALEAFEAVEEWGSFGTENLRYFFPEVLGPLRKDPRYRRIVDAVDRRWESDGADGSHPSRHRGKR